MDKKAKFKKKVNVIPFYIFFAYMIFFSSMLGVGGVVGSKGNVGWLVVFRDYTYSPKHQTLYIFFFFFFLFLLAYRDRETPSELVKYNREKKKRAGWNDRERAMQTPSTINITLNFPLFFYVVLFFL